MCASSAVAPPVLTCVVVALVRAVPPVVALGGGGLPVGDPEPGVLPVKLDVNGAGREGAVVQVTAMRVVHGIGELVDHDKTGVELQVWRGG